MKPLLLTAVLSLYALCMASRAEDKPAPGTQVAQSVEVTADKDAKTTVHYLLALPPASETKPAGGYPLMLFMHGAGEKGSDLNLVKKHGPPKLVGKSPELNKFIVVSPQCPAGQRGWDVVAMKGLIDHIAATQPVDKNRIIITGLSMGGFGTWSFLAKYPDLPVAAVPICGRGKPETAASFKDVPIHCYHGAKDPTVPQKYSDEMIEALKKAGGKPEYTVFPDAAHDSWTAAYADPKLYEWMLAQKKPAK
ncbi:MAG TPA: dienelactone hydrolase family protein [Verrucomicrobiales bacterium]|jgi:predicted peptidase|nr:dienelactone hydrolase family protein [Verrucomicrobiales bacterium]